MSLAEIQPVSQTERAKSEALLRRVDAIIQGVVEKEASLQRDYVDVGVVLIDVRDAKAWMIRDFHSFEAYLKDISGKLRKGRTQLYGYASVAERLLPSVSKEDLIEMGVTAASILAQMVKITKKSPSKELVEIAKTRKEDELRFEVAKFSGLRATSDSGEYFHLGEVYFEDGELEEFMRAVKVAAEQNKIECPREWKDIPPRTKKVILKSWYADFFSTYGK